MWQTDKVVQLTTVSLVQQVTQSGFTAADSVRQRSRLVHLFSQEAAVGRAAEAGHQLLETGGDPAKSILSTLAFALSPPCCQLVH